MDKQPKLTVTTSPHLHSEESVSGAMRDVIIALIPVTLVSIYWFGLNAVFTVALCMITAVITDFAFKYMLGRKKQPFDGSALVTGLLIALCFSVNTPWWTFIIATVIGVGVAKELMGGIGWNRFNPALFGRVSAVIFAPAILNGVNAAFAPLGFNLGTIDVVTSATPLALLKQGTDLPSLGALFAAFPGGALGETSAIALIIGGAYLIVKKHIGWYTPVGMIAAVVVMGLIFDAGSIGAAAPLYHVFSGGVLLGAFFMATDWVTSPITPKGKIIFGIAIGVLLMIFRLFLAPVEGTAFSILIMNAFVPMIDRLTKRPKFGEVFESAPAAAPSTQAPVAGKKA